LSLIIQSAIGIYRLRFFICVVLLFLYDSAPVNESIVQQNMDELLLPFLRETDEAQAQLLLAQLVSVHAASVVKKIINSRLGFSTSFSRSDADDVQSEATISLLLRLKECKADPQNKAINDFRNYAAVTAYRACYEYLRRKFPERHKLKNRLRYLLNHNDSFAIWENVEGKFLCGFADWQGRSEGENRQLAELLSREEARQTSLAEILTSVFRRCHTPLEIDELVSLLADRLGITDVQAKATASVGELEQMADSQLDVAEQFDRRLYMRKLWQEICELPVRQRIALLLNLKDEMGRGCIALFQLTGIATMRQMAKVMDMTIEKLADIWNDLPMEDAKIADLLQLTRQQVINLRKSARERLARRLKMF
jgi:RNA polymerase sigma factor (sigma-70 family)